jgi:hypothetical protein
VVKRLVIAGAVVVLALGVGFGVSALVAGRGAGSRQIRNDHIVHVTPVPHANGLIAYLRAETPQGPHTVYVARQDGVGLRQLTPSSLQVGSVAWSPDGSKIAYIASGMTGHGGDLMVANADGSDPHTLFACPIGCVGYAGVTWSPTVVSLPTGPIVLPRSCPPSEASSTSWTQRPARSCET